MRKALIMLAVNIVLAGGPALAQVTYTSQTRHVSYEIEVGDAYSTDFYDNSVSAPDFEPFDAELALP